MKCSLGMELAALLTLGLLTQGCSGSSEGGTGGAGGQTLSSGGSSQPGGTTSATGGVTPTGGLTMASGGATASADGGSTASGGTLSSLGGTTVQSGGTPSTGGTIGASGGVTLSTGGAGGASSGAASSTGGTTVSQGGTSSAKGGSAPTGGTTAAAGGASAAGGSKETGGTTSVTGGTSATGGTKPASGNEFWISPTGSDTAAGTKDAPLFTLCNDSQKTGACYKLCPVGGGCSGGTIWVMDGTYKYGGITQKIGSAKIGTAASPLNVFAVAGATPVFDFTGMPLGSANRGLQVGGDYWHIKGITVTKAGDTGIFIMGNNNTIEQCVSHHNQDAGFVIGVNASRTDATGLGNLVLNCDSYANYDPATDGGNADGFGAKENTGGPGNIFRGCRAWENSDDGFDFYGWGSPITVDNCWVMSQSTTLSGSQSNGNGFKLGGNNIIVPHILKNLYAVGNGANAKSGDGNGNGFEANSNTAPMPCTGTCGAWSNKSASVHGTNITGVTVTSGPTAAKMIAAPRAADGSLPAIGSL